MLRLQCTKFDSDPDPAGGAYIAPTDSLVGYKGPTFKERGGKDNGGKRREGRTGEGKRGKRGGRGRDRGVHPITEGR